MKPLRFTVIQNSAGPDIDRNLRDLEELMDRADAPDVIALPEIFALRAAAEQQVAAAEDIPGRLSGWLSQQAVDRDCSIIGGSLYEAAGEKVFNTMLVMNRRGEEVARYRKIHLFDADLKSGEVLRESDQFLAGEHPQVSIINGWMTGLSICYDLRFPELYRKFADHDAALIVVAANFTRYTGEAHWESLIRARAIENQCYVVAPAQCGVHSGSGVVSHGHSLIVDPWGTVLSDAGEEPGLVEAVLDPAVIQETRQQVPALRHRRL